MKLVSARVRNYKCFLDSGEIEFSPTLNVVIGRNNGGKSALLDALGLGFENKPHRSTTTARFPGQPTDQVSSVEFRYSLGGGELKNLLRLGVHGSEWHVPVAVDSPNADGTSTLARLLSAKSIEAGALLANGVISTHQPLSSPYQAFPIGGGAHQFTWNHHADRLDHRGRLASTAIGVEPCVVGATLAELRTDPRFAAPRGHDPLAALDAAAVLDAAFEKLAGRAYSKVNDGPGMIEWLLAHQPEALEEVMATLRAVLDASRPSDAPLTTRPPPITA